MGLAGAAAGAAEAKSTAAADFGTASFRAKIFWTFSELAVNTCMFVWLSWVWMTLLLVWFSCVGVALVFGSFSCVCMTMVLEWFSCDGAALVWVWWRCACMNMMCAWLSCVCMIMLGMSVWLHFRTVIIATAWARRGLFFPCVFLGQPA